MQMVVCHQKDQRDRSHTWVTIRVYDISQYKAVIKLQLQTMGSCLYHITISCSNLLKFQGGGEVRCYDESE